MGAASGALSLATIAAASAQEAGPSANRGLELRWSAPAACPRTGEVERDVRRILGGPAQPEPALAATVVVRQDESGSWRAGLITVQGGVEGERELTGVDCAEVAHAVALVLALMVAPSSPSPASRPAPAPDADVAPAPPPRPPPPERSDRVWRGLGRSGVLLGTGTLPSSDAGATLHLGVASRWLSAEVRLSAWLPRTTYADVEPSMGAELWALAVTPTPCARWPAGASVRLDTCAGVGMTQAKARGFGMSDPSVVTARWGVIRAEQAAAFTLSDRVRVRPSFEVSWPLSRPRFAIENVGELHRPERTAFSGGLAAELGF